MAYPDYIMKEAKEVVARWTKEGCLDFQIYRTIRAAEIRAYNQAIDDAAGFLGYDAARVIQALKKVGEQ